MKHNVIKKIALTGLLGLGIASQTLAGGLTSWFKEKYDQVSWPTMNLGKLYTPGLQLNLASMSRKDAGIVFGAAAATCASIWGAWHGYNKYQAYRKTSAKHAAIKRAIIDADYNVEEGVSEDGRKECADFIREFMYRPETQKAILAINIDKTQLLDSIKAAIRNDGNMFSLKGFLHKNGAKAIYQKHQGWFDNNIELYIKLHFARPLYLATYGKEAPRGWSSKKVHEVLEVRELYKERAIYRKLHKNTPAPEQWSSNKIKLQNELCKRNIVL